MFVHYRTLAFIFKKEDRGEADQLFTVYSKNFGKLEILGKGIRKISSKLRAGADIFYLSEIEFIQGRGYKTLTDAILIEKFNNLKKELKRLKIAYKISEILDKLLKGQEADEKIWRLLIETFKELNNPLLSINRFIFLYYYFFWNFFTLLGYKPELYYCILCQKRPKETKIYFSPKEGGIICQDCFKKVKLGKELDVNTVKILRIILKKNWYLFKKIKIEKKYLKELELVTKAYFLLYKNTEKNSSN